VKYNQKNLEIYFNIFSEKIEKILKKYLDKSPEILYKLVGGGG
jgi:hypothetical protein